MEGQLKPTSFNSLTQESVCYRRDEGWAVEALAIILAFGLRVSNMVEPDVAELLVELYLSEGSLGLSCCFGEPEVSQRQ